MKVAIIGSGISGLGAAHVLHPHHEIDVYEKANQPGGHAHTVVVKTGDADQPVDTGFIVYNEVNYPNFTRLLDQLGVETLTSDMSFGMHSPAEGFAYSSRGVKGLLATPRNILRPNFHRMVRDILRFNKLARTALRQPDVHTSQSMDTRHATPQTDVHTLGSVNIEGTLGDFLRRHRFSDAFVRYYISPMSSAIWSAAPGKTLSFPALTFFRFFQNHGLLSVSPDIPWRTVKDGSRSYVNAITRPFKERIHVNSPVQRIERKPNHVRIFLNDGPARIYDKVILAVHADQALRMLADPSNTEKRLLARYPYQSNRVALHNDTALLPRQPAAWASWNVRVPRDREDTPLAMHYHMNRLQQIGGSTNYLVTLNPETNWLSSLRQAPNGTKLFFETDYEHPAYHTESFTLQHELATLNGPRNTCYCGAYFGYGFHEDGLNAGLNAARALGVEWPS